MHYHIYHFSYFNREIFLRSSFHFSSLTSAHYWIIDIKVRISPELQKNTLRLPECEFKNKKDMIWILFKNIHENQQRLKCRMKKVLYHLFKRKKIERKQNKYSINIKYVEILFLSVLHFFLFGYSFLVINVNYSWFTMLIHFSLPFVSLTFTFFENGIKKTP